MLVLDPNVVFIACRIQETKLRTVLYTGKKESKIYQIFEDLVQITSAGLKWC